MENDSILTLVMEINKGINLQFRTSKAPLFFRKFMANKRRIRVKRIINRLHDLKDIEKSLISDYIRLLYSLYSPNGTYKNCIRIEPLDQDSTLLSALFEFHINNDTDEIGIVTLSPDTDNSYLIKYMWLRNGITIFSNFVENKKVLINKETYNSISKPYLPKYEADIIHDSFCKCIMDNIYTFLMEDIERSERLINNDRIEIK